jgi:hypothetical protein
LTAAAIAGAVLEMLGEAAAVAGEGRAAPGRTRYCLADVAGRHCLGRAGFIPIGSYHGRRGDIPRFAGREEAEAVVGWLRAEDAALRVMVVRPGCRPAPLDEEKRVARLRRRGFGVLALALPMAVDENEPGMK